MAEAYSVIGKSNKAVEIYEKLVESIKKTDEGYVDLQIAYGDALRGTVTRENRKKVLVKVDEAYGKVLPQLITDKDDRAVDAGVLSARIKLTVTGDDDGAKKLMENLEATYGEGDRGTEVKYWSGFFLILSSDEETGTAKLKALVKDGDSNDPWVKKAKEDLEWMDGN